MSGLVVLDASAGVEIVLRTARGEDLIAVLESRDVVVIAPSHFLVEGAGALRENLTIADALYVVLARRAGAALMIIDERMLGAPGLDDIPLLRS